jgi:hypothetical protein
MNPTQSDLSGAVDEGDDLWGVLICSPETSAPNVGRNAPDLAITYILSISFLVEISKEHHPVSFLGGFFVPSNHHLYIIYRDRIVGRQD